MVSPFEFASAARILFGVGAIHQLAGLAAEHGRRALVVTGRDPTRVAPVLRDIQSAGLTTTVFTVAGEPSTADAERGVAIARAADCDLVIAIGGGSPLDAGKAIAALLHNPGPILDYLEVIGHGRPLTRDPAPFLAVPTTAGTGSEVTRNAVLTAREHGVKVSLRSAKMLPRLALVDPALTLSLPPHITADCGLDALTQLIEPLVSHRHNPITDALCREAIPRAARSLRRGVTIARAPCPLLQPGYRAITRTGPGRVFVMHDRFPADSLMIYASRRTLSGPGIRTCAYPPAVAAPCRGFKRSGRGSARAG